MGNRIASIDILRGIAISGMILCAYIGWNSGLPAWMFHAQTPPPFYTFNPSIPGITWVDIVFPLFLFTMGAAFPLAYGKKLENGTSNLKIFGVLVKRWGILTAFALILGNAYAIGESTRPHWQINLYQIGLWTSMFLALVRSKKVINLTGVVLLITALLLQAEWFGISPSKSRSDIIIMILGLNALFGGVIWLFTRNRISTRWLVIGFIAAIKALYTYLPHKPTVSEIGWIFSWEWLQYLIIVLSGSIAGDVILINRQKQNDTDRKDIAASIIAVSAVVVQLWGLYCRHIAIDLAVTITLSCIYLILNRRKSGHAQQIGRTGFILLIVGILFDPIDGGIAKDPCNLSYLFTTAGMAGLLLSFILIMEVRFGYKGKFIGGVGQNPMLAYTVVGFFIMPIMSLTCLFPLISKMADNSIFWGMTQGLLITGIMMGVTYLCTHMKLFWKS